MPDGVSREVKMLQVDILLEILDSLDVVVRQREPGEQVDILQCTQ